MKLPELKLKTKNLKLKTGIFLFVIFLALSFGYVKAQEIQRSITLINPSVSVVLDPGQNSEGTTAIINESNFPVTFTAGVQDYIVQDNRGTPEFLNPGTLNNKYSAASWIAVYPSTFTLGPGERQKINYYIKVPGNASPCGHYAGIVYQPSTNPNSKETGTTVQQKLGTLFYITVKGECKESASVTKFLSPSFQEYGPVNVLTEIKNNGDLHIRPQGTITLTGFFSNQSYKLNPENIFPQTSRDFQNTVGQGFMLGQYKAVLLASYGVNNNLPLTATVYFWVFPWRLALVLFLIIIALILGLLYIKRRKKKGPKAPQEAETASKEPEATTVKEETSVDTTEK